MDSTKTIIHHNNKDYQGFLCLKKDGWYLTLMPVKKKNVIKKVAGKAIKPAKKRVKKKEEAGDED